MDKSCQSSADSTTSSSSITTSSATNSSRDHYLRQLNKLSQKISKPIIKKPTLDPPPPPPPPPPPHHQSHPQQNHHSFNNQNQPQPQAQAQAQQNLQHQPPVYNINKNDFRDVVQKLTGSPAHDRISTPPPIQQPKPPSSRLQRIRPPPLPHITNRPPPLLNAAIPRPQPQPPPPNVNFNAFNFNHNFSGFGRPPAPLSPLPPFPTVHAPAESPISAYMRDLQNLVSTMDSKNFSGFSPLPPPVSPHPHPHPHPHSQPQPQPQALPQQQQQQQQQGMVPSQTPPPPVVQSQSPFQMPSSPVPFGCLNSPLSSYPLLSPGLLFSPSSGQLGFPQLPLSPTVPVPSPRWRGL